MSQCKCNKFKHKAIESYKRRKLSVKITPMIKVWGMKMSESTYEYKFKTMITKILHNI